MAPVDKPSNDFDFFQIFTDIFDYFGALLVSMTPVKNFLPVKHSKTIKVSLTGVVDTGKKLFTSVNDTGNECIAGVVDTGEALK